MALSQVSIRCPNCQRMQFFPYRHEQFGRGISTVTLELEDHFKVTCKNCGNLICGELNHVPQNLMMLYEITSQPTAPPPGESHEAHQNG